MKLPAGTLGTLKIALLITMILFFEIPPILTAQEEIIQSDAAIDELLIGFKQYDGDLEALIKQKKFEVIKKVDQINVLQVKIKGGSLKDLIELSTIKYVEPNYIVKLESSKLWPLNISQSTIPLQIGMSSEPNDPLWASDTSTGRGQWNMRIIQADMAWDIEKGIHDVKVAVIDTGVFWEHEDLDGNYIPGGYDWVNNDAFPNDDNGHGSWVAGIIAAETNNGYGVAGVAQVSIIAEKVLNRNGEGTVADVANGIVHAADLGAHIINLSLGIYSSSATLRDAVEYALSKGCLLVAAAGNSGTSQRHYPAAFEGVVSVASTYGEPDDIRAPYSGYGIWITISAPGGYDANRNGEPDEGEYWIISTSNRRDIFMMGTGTSAATPLVSGLAALVKSKNSTANSDEILEMLKKGVQDKGESGWDPFYGYGRINAYKTLLGPKIISVGGTGEIIITHHWSSIIPQIGSSLLMVIIFLFIIYLSPNLPLRLQRKKPT